MKKTKIISFIKWYALILFLQVCSGILTSSFMYPWYGTLKKASWNPPNWVFGPVWTVLYLLMAISIWLVSQTNTSQKEKSFAYIIFFIQLILNVLWTFLFFYMHNPFWALIELGVLIIFIGVTIFLFWRIHRGAALLLIPYLFWCLYAFSLNFAIVMLNS